MIYPARAAVWAAVAGAPLTLALAVAMPDRWYAGLAWPVAVLALTLVDALIGGRRVTAAVAMPATVSVGEPFDIDITARFVGGAPSAIEVAVPPVRLLEVENDGRLWVPTDADGRALAQLPTIAIRRGTAQVDAVWLRWRGPLGLAWNQQRIAADATIAILPDIRPVHERGAAIFQRHALQGLIAQVDRGDGADFDALVEFRSGMDRRAIDWKQSARHQKLHAKEYRSERNSQIVFAIDAGRQMSDPVAGLPRVDRAVSAMLLTAWVALKLGDRVALHAFDARPRIASGLISGVAAFPELQRLAARIDYGRDETNYSFALSTLSARLTRRSMIVLFTEFTDLTSANFLVRAVARMAEKHLILIVVLRDEELESIADAAPATADDVTRAVTAAALLRDRRLALTRLRHLGVHIIESLHDRVGEALVAGYVDLKRRNLL